MASAVPTTKIILTRSEDWEGWFSQLRKNVHKDLWPYIDPDSPERALLVAPERPQVTEFNPQAQAYSGLSAAQQKAYDAARKYFDQDMKYYLLQCDQILAASNYITSSVSISKQSTLDSNLSIREWLVQLKNDTEPSQGYMLTQLETRYRNTLKSFKASKILNWLEEWEAIMVDCIKHDLPEVKHGRWLRDLARCIRPVSDAFHIRLLGDANDKDKSDPTNFRKVARELREALGPQGGRTARGGAFPGFGPTEPSEDSSDAAAHAGGETNRAKSQGRKRSGTDSHEADKASKKIKSGCAACGMKGHSLPECWCVFEELRPEGALSNKYRARKAKKALEESEELSQQVKELREKMKEKK